MGTCLTLGSACDSVVLVVPAGHLRNLVLRASRSMQLRKLVCWPGQVYRDLA